MKTFLRLINTTMAYPWGSYDAIAELLGQTGPHLKPQAELWMGAHPKAPSAVLFEGRRRRLDELIRDLPREILGEAEAGRYRHQMPFLFKVLSARQPLSIQAHPDAGLASAGFDRENDLGIPLDAPERNYRDANHKPECVCALSEFWALCGFRPLSEIFELIKILCPVSLAADLNPLKQQSAGALRALFPKLLKLDKSRRSELIAEALANLKKLRGSADREAAAYWIDRIAADFPQDIGILAPALLNLIRLEPQQALFLPAGCLHAYLGGTALELMASSDNVLRGGLTKKHVDVDQLLLALAFDARRPEIIRPVPLGPAESYYPCPAREFRLSVLMVDPDRPYQSQPSRSVEILLCIQGEVRIESTHDPGNGIDICKGTSILVPAAAPAYRVVGHGVLYRADVPRQ